MDNGLIMARLRGKANRFFSLKGGACSETRTFSATTEGASVGRMMKLTSSRQDIESARLRMLRARQALEDYERANGCATTSEHIRLSFAFRRATQMYLKLSRTQC